MFILRGGGGGGERNEQISSQKNIGIYARPLLNPVFCAWGCSWGGYRCVLPNQTHSDITIPVIKKSIEHPVYKAPPPPPHTHTQQDKAAPLTFEARPRSSRTSRSCADIASLTLVRKIQQASSKGLEKAAVAAAGAEGSTHRQHQQDNDMSVCLMTTRFCSQHCSAREHDNGRTSDIFRPFSIRIRRFFT